MNLEQVERLFWYGAAACFLALAILLYGEFAGWWNDAGEVAITVVSILGTLLAAIAILLNATRGQASAIAQGVERNGAKLDTANGKLDTLHEDMGEQTQVLMEIRDRL